MDLSPSPNPSLVQLKVNLEVILIDFFFYNLTYYNNIIFIHYKLILLIFLLSKFWPTKTRIRNFVYEYFNILTNI